MARFSMGKSVDDVQEPVLLPEDWYTMIITKEPEMAPNKKMRDGGADAEGAGHNIVLEMQVISDVSEFSGRQFRYWLSLPTSADSEKFTQDGRTIEDFKVAKIVEVVSAFGGMVDGADIELENGMQAQFYVLQEASERGPRNSIDINTAPRPV